MLAPSTRFGGEQSRLHALAMYAPPARQLPKAASYNGPMISTVRRPTRTWACVLLAGFAFSASVVSIAPATAQTTTTRPASESLPPDLKVFGGKVTGSVLTHPVTLNVDEATNYLVGWVRLTVFGNPPLGPIPTNTPTYQVDIAYQTAAIPRGTQTSYLARNGTHVWGSGTGKPNTWTPLGADIFTVFNGKVPVAVAPVTPPPIPRPSSDSSTSTAVVLVVVLVGAAGVVGLLLLLLRRRNRRETPA